MNQAVAPNPRLRERYQKEIVPVLMKEFQFSNVMQAPRLMKVVVNMGIKDVKDDVKTVELLAAELGMIVGQKPVVTKAKKSIAAFKLREGNPVGIKVTLRGARMFEFVDRLFNVALPRIRDFRGFPTTSFDGRGNYTFGLQEQMIFPELEFDKIKKTQGMDITFVTTARTDEESKRLLTLLGLPFRKGKE